MTVFTDCPRLCTIQPNATFVALGHVILSIDLIGTIISFYIYSIVNQAP